MATTIAWGTKVISVLRADMTLIQSVPTEIRQLDLNVFRLELKDLEDGEAGMSHIHTHNHNTEVTVGGVTLARVIEIINGYTVTFEDGQYAVNLVSANSNVADVTNVNQVSVRSSNSAGLVTSQAIEFGEYGNAVHVSQANGSTGTVYPKGTHRDPVNNLTDAKAIASFRGFDRITLLGNFTFGVSDVLDGFEILGRSPSKTNIILTSSATIINCTFKAATVSGTLDGGSEVLGCHITNLTYVTGSIHDCQFNIGVIKLGTDSVGMLDCWSGVPGVGTPIIDFDDKGADLIMRNYSGGITLRNKSLPGDSSIELDAGHVILEPTVNSGSLSIRGIGKLTDNSGAGATVLDEMVQSSDVKLARDHARATNAQTQGA